MTDSPILRLRIAELRTPDTLRKVRLMRVTKARWEREHPEAVAGKIQAKRMNESRRAKKAGRDVAPESGVTFVTEMMKQLDLRRSGVEKLITLGRRIPSGVLSAVARRDRAIKTENGKGIRAKGGLLERLSSAFDPKKAMPDWQRIVEDHINPPRFRGTDLDGGFAMGPGYYFVGEDSRRHLEHLVGRQQFPAIIIDPPYGTNIPRRVNGMMVDDQQGALWAIPLLAKLLAPQGMLGVWCSGDTLGRWANALLGEDLTIAQWVRWDKESEWHEERGDEVMLVAGKGIPKSYGPPLSVIKHPTLPANAPERLLHDTPKPEGLFVPIIEHWTQPGDVVLDCFAGLAPLGEACLQLGRGYHGYELVPKVAAFAIKRLKKAVPAPNRRPVVTAEDRLEWQRLFDAQMPKAPRPAD